MGQAYEVDGQPRRRLQWNLTGVEAVDQELKILLTTSRGSVVMDRDFGIDTRILSKPAQVARAMAQQDIVSTIRRYVPRARVRRVTFREQAHEILDGRIMPVVEWELVE